MPPIGGADGIAWSESDPPVTANAGLGYQAIQSVKTSARQVIAAEHNFASSGGDDQGYHLYGSARPYYGTQSAVSSSGSDGRIMLTSDTSRLFGVGSGGTVFLGGPTVLSLGTFPDSLPQRSVWVEEFGEGLLVTSSGSTTITFPNSGFSGVPYTNAFITATVAGIGGFLQAVNIDGASVIIQCNTVSGTFSLSAITFNWFSRGTRTL